MSKIKIAIQGYEGSYSHQVVKEIFQKNNWEFFLVENATFHEAFTAIEKYGLGLIPVENSTAGFVYQAIQEFSRGEFEVIGEYFLHINHVLLGIKGAQLNDIQEVHSHHQALMQTSNFLQENMIQSVDAGDTAGGARYIAKENDVAKGALGAEILSEVYGLGVLQRDINNEEGNTTRFMLIQKKGGSSMLVEKKGVWKNSLIFKMKDTPGALYNVLGCFAKEGVSLSNIISQPIEGEKFKYAFFIEFFGNKESGGIQRVLKNMEAFTEEIRYLGNYQEIV